MSEEIMTASEVVKRQKDHLQALAKIASEYPIEFATAANQIIRRQWESDQRRFLTRDQRVTSDFPET